MKLYAQFQETSIPNRQPFATPPPKSPSSPHCAITAYVPTLLTITDPRDLSDRQLLLLILERLDTMATTADDTKAAVDALDTKVDALIAAITPALTNLQTQLKAAQDQLTALQTTNAADKVTLQTTISEAQAEATKVDAAITALTPTPSAP